MFRPCTLGLLVALTLALACDGGPPRSFIEIALVTPAGGSPLDGIDALAVTVRQGADAPLVAMADVSSEGFMLDLELLDFERPIDIAVELTGASARLVGGTPELVPSETGRSGELAGLVVIAVAPPRSCAVVDGMTFDVPRARAAVSQQGTFATVLGGESLLGPTDAASFLDLIRLGVRAEGDPPPTLDDLPVPIDAASAYPISLARALVVSEAQPPFLYDITGRCPEGGDPVCAVQPAPVGLHAGTGSSSAIVVLRGGGIVVAGGDATGASTDEISWVDGDGRVIRTRLATPRAGAHAVEIASSADRILVVGGEAEGAPFAEIVARGLDGAPVAGARPGPARTGGALFSDGADGALFVGGVDAMGAPVAETVRVTGCDTGCALSAGPRFERARLGPSAAPRRLGGGLLLGGDGPVALVDEVSFDSDGTAHVEPHADLASPRAGATPLVLPNGVVFVVGGLGPMGPLADVEMCVPETVALP
jgi:hypothetical protein